MEKGKKKCKKKAKIQYLAFLCHNRLQPSVGISQNLKTLALIGPEKSVMKFFIGEKKKWTNKGNDKHEEADSLLHNISSCTQCL